MSSERDRPEGAAAPAAPSRYRVPLRLEEALGAVALGLICAISFANVVVRYATNVSFAFTEEFSVFLLAFMTFVGASLAFAKDGHIRILFFVERLPPRLRRACGWTSLGVTVALLGLIAYYGALFTLDEWRYGETSPGLGYPNWIYTVWLPLLVAAMLARLAGRAWAMYRNRPRS